MKNYINNVKKRLGKSSFEGLWEGFENALKDSLNCGSYENGSLGWLKEVAKYHINEDSGSNYWIDRAKANNITARKIDDADSLDGLLNLLGDADTDLLKQETGYRDFYMPKAANIQDLFKSSSSGTTGPAKTVYHSAESLTLSAVDEYTGIKAQFPAGKIAGKVLLATGPNGAYQKEHEILADMLNMDYIGNGFETKGLKLLGKEEFARAISPVIKNTVDALYREEVGLMPNAMEMLGILPKEYLQKVDVLKLSGTTITPQGIIDAEKNYKNKIIPMYGHYAGKSSIGFLSEDLQQIDYFPAYPATIIKINDKNQTAIGYGDRGRIKLIVAEPELLLIKDEDYAGRAKPKRFFKSVDGLSDPGRDQ